MKINTTHRVTWAQNQGGVLFELAAHTEDKAAGMIIARALLSYPDAMEIELTDCKTGDAIDYKPKGK